MANTDFKLYLHNYSSNLNPKITNKMITGTICWIKQIIHSPIIQMFCFFPHWIKGV